MLALALALSVTAGPPAEQVRVLIDDPKVRLTQLTADQEMSAGPAGTAAAEVLVVVEGRATVQAGALRQTFSSGDALYAAAAQPWILAPWRPPAPALSRPGAPVRLLVLEAPRAEREWRTGTEGAAGAPPAEQPQRRSLREGATYPILGGKGAATIIFDSEVTRSPAASYQRMSLAPGAAVPEHDHAAEVEILHVLSGATELTMGGKTSVLKAGDSVLIPAGVRHSARVVSTELVQAIQFYVPGGPEQRFKAAAKVANPAIVQSLHDAGKQLLQARRHDQALSAYVQCVALDPAHADCHLGAGSTYARLRQPEAGYQHYQRFLELAPGHERAAEVRKLLQDYEKKKVNRAGGGEAR